MAAVHQRAKGTGSIQYRNGRWHIFAPEKGGKKRRLHAEETRWAAERWLAKWLKDQGLTPPEVGR